MKTQLQTVLVALVAGLALAACNASVNEPVEIADGTQDATATSTVNGSIRVGDDVTVTEGTFRSVNGSARIGARSQVPSVTLVNGPITVGADSRTGSLATVNGDISVGENTVVGDDIESVNGAVALAQGARVDGNVTTVNGRIELDGATVVGNLENVNGGMSLSGTAVVDGDLRVLEPRGVSTSDTVPVVTIGAEARVTGTLTFEREVELRLHRDAEVGEIVGATPEFSDG